MTFTDCFCIVLAVLDEEKKKKIEKMLKILWEKVSKLKYEFT